MFTKTVSILIISVILGLTVTTPLMAQNSQTKQEKNTAKIKEKVKSLGTGERAGIKVKLYTGTVYQGYVSESNEVNFTVVDKSGKSNPVAYSDVGSVGGKGMSGKAKMAMGIAIGAGAVLLVLAAIIASDN